jgi:general secretion pathway protein H
MKASRGHTLIELLVVAGIAASAAAVTVPHLASGRDAAAAQAAAGEVANALRLARADAVTRQREVTWRPEQARVPLAEAPSEIRFFTDGSSTGGRIVVAAGGRRKVVEVAWLTGRVRVHD